MIVTISDCQHSAVAFTGFTFDNSKLATSELSINTASVNKTAGSYLLSVTGMKFTGTDTDGDITRTRKDSQSVGITLLSDELPAVTINTEEAKPCKPESAVSTHRSSESPNSIDELLAVNLHGANNDNGSNFENFYETADPDSTPAEFTVSNSSDEYELDELLVNNISTEITSDQKQNKCDGSATSDELPDPGDSGIPEGGMDEDFVDSNQHETTECGMRYIETCEGSSPVAAVDVPTAMYTKSSYWWDNYDTGESQINTSDSASPDSEICGQSLSVPLLDTVTTDVLVHHNPFTDPEDSPDNHESCHHEHKTVTSTSMFSSMLKMLECPTCMEESDKPKSLSCLHWVCSKCAETIHQDGVIVCPQCRAITEVPEGSVENLATEFKIVQFRETLESVQNTREEPVDTTGHALSVIAKDAKGDVRVCINHDTTADFTCRDCEVFLCTKCQEFHNTRPLFTAHTIVGIEKVVCAKHNHTYTYFCTKCAVFLCRICLCDWECVGHDADIKTYQEVTSTAQNNVETLISSLKNQIYMINKDVIPCLSIVESKIADVLQVKDNLDRYRKAMIDKVESQFKELYTEVDVCHEILLDVHENMKQQDPDSLRDLLECAEQSKSQCVEEMLVTMTAIKARIPPPVDKTFKNKANSIVTFKQRDSLNSAEFKFTWKFEDFTDEEMLSVMTPGTRVKKGRDLTEHDGYVGTPSFPEQCEEGTIREVYVRNPPTFFVNWDSDECTYNRYIMGQYRSFPKIYRLDLA